MPTDTMIEQFYEKDEDDGGSVLTFKCFDNDADDCNVRLRVTKSGDWQLYVDFDTIMIVYNLEEY